MLFYTFLSALEPDEQDCAHKIFEDYQKYICKTASRYLHKHHDIEDTLDNVMINVIKNIGRFMNASPKDIEAQLFIYTKHAAINLYKKNKRRSEKETSLTYANESEEAEMMDLPDPDQSVENIILSKEKAEIVQKFVTRLSEDYQEILLLVYRLGYSNVEAARVLHITPNAVGLRLFKAKKKLLEISGDNYMNTTDRTLDALLVVAMQDMLDDEVAAVHSMDTQDIDISSKITRRIRRRIRQHARESWWASVPMACRQTLATILIVCTVFFGMCISVKAVRAEIVSTVLKWYDEFVAVFFVAEEAPLYIEEYREPTLQIAGTERQVIMQIEKCYRVVYIIGDSVEISYQQTVISDDSIDIDSELECIQKDGKVNGYDAILLEYTDGKKIVTWHDNGYSYLLNSFAEDIDFETLLALAESVK